MVVLGGMLGLITYDLGLASFVVIGLGVFLILASSRFEGLLARIMGWQHTETKPRPAVRWGQKKEPEPYTLKSGQVITDKSAAPEKPVETQPPVSPAGQPEKPAAAWAPKKGPAWLRFMPHASRQKFRIPGFRQLKRVAAVVCVVLNFFIGEMALTAPNSQLLSVFFLVSAYLLADYVWKTRTKPGDVKE